MLAELETEVLSLQTQRQLPSPLQALHKLTGNYWWSWAADGAAIFRDLDSETWAACEQNPIILLRQTSDFRLAQMAADPLYQRRVAALAGDFEKYLGHTQLWSARDRQAAIAPEHPVAYFCAEFGIHNSLPLYSGGLGILAGDHLKSASDLNLPLVAVGLLYRFGYFRQHLRADGWQQESYRETETTDLAIDPVTDDAGQRLLIEVMMRGRAVRAQVWRANVGRVALYLLDTNIPENDETDRLVTGHLYGGDRETRLVQEMMLGIGGVRLLRALGISPSVYHLNEGHSAFLTLELTRELIESERLSFADAAEKVRQRCVFTTHTPVAAGHDEFEKSLLEECAGAEAIARLGLTTEQFMALGQSGSGNTDEAFGLTPLALRMTRSINAVSRKHGEVSRSLWQKMWPDRDVNQVPITSVTNGVHAATWAAPLIRSLFEMHLGEAWATRDAGEWAAGIERISDEALWRSHSLLRQKLIAYVRESVSRNDNGEADPVTESETPRLNPDALTIGFARRVA